MKTTEIDIDFVPRKPYNACPRCGRVVEELEPPVTGPDGDSYRWRCPRGGLQKVAVIEFPDPPGVTITRIPPYEEHDDVG
jgi:hypothetical protein